MPLCRRNLSMLSAMEEFDHSIKLSPANFGQAFVKESVLKNGIKIISSHVENSKISKVQVTLTSGSSFETINQKGCAHLASVSAFNGSAKMSGLNLAYNLENLGASVKCFADREKIVYDLTVLPDKLESSLELIAEALKFKYKPHYLVKEAKEIAQVSYDKLAANPVDQAVEYLYEAAYGELTPLGGSLYSENLPNLDVKEFSSFVSSHFKSGNIIISSSGVSHESLKQLVESVFNDTVSGESSSGLSTYQGGYMKVRKDLSGSSYVGLGFEVFPQQVASNKVLMSLLVKSVSSKTNLNTVFSTFSKTGFIGFIISGESEVTATDTKEIISNLKAIAKSCPPIENIKKQIKLDYTLSLEGDKKTSALLELALGRNFVKSLDDVSSKSVSVVANQVLTSIPSYVVLGKTYGTLSYNEVINLLK